MRLLLLYLLLCLWAGLALGEASQSHTAIMEAVRHYLETQVVPPGSDHRIDITPVDSRLQLHPCDGALDTFRLGEGRNASMVTVGVRCSGSTPWTIYVRAKLAVYQTVLVLREPVSQDALIGDAQLDIAAKDVASLTGGYYTDPAQVLGKRAKHNLPGGIVLNGNLLETPKIIKRGQRVAIRVSSGLLNVEVEGTAMADAEPGQSLKVRNEASKRIVEGVAVAPGVVEMR